MKQISEVMLEKIKEVPQLVDATYAHTLNTGILFENGDSIL